MAMPRQLREARRPKRYQPRPLFETLPAVDAKVLARRKLFPGNWFDRIQYDFAVPGAVIAIARRNIEIVHRSGNQQTVAIHWQRISGATNSQRPMFQCGCGRNAFRLYNVSGLFRCYRCAIKLGVHYASQQRSRTSRPALQAARLRQFLTTLPDSAGTPRKPFLMRKKTYRRLLSRLQRLEAKISRKRLPITRLDCRMLKPNNMYSVQLGNV